MRPQRIPEAEIRFAAKTGFLSKPIWDEFFAEGSARWKRRQWQLFQQRGLFVRHPSRLPKDVLVLYRKCNEVKRIVGGAIALPPFAPQIEHDEIVAKIVLSLKKAGQVLDFRFETEMKREEWGEKRRFSDSEKTKYPDCVLEVASPNGVLKIALELELTRKSPKRYRQILASYAARKDLSHVLFVARSNSIFESLKGAMRETYYPDSERPVGFCDLDAWLVNPGRASIYFSEGASTLEKMSQTKGSAA